MRIVVYGGSFDPPHLGHLRAAMASSEYFAPDRFLVIPACQPPHKELSGGSPGAGERLEMCRLCFGNIPNCTVSDLELRRGGKSYTADTISALREEHPEAEIVLLMGTDMFESLDKWVRAEYIIKNVTVGVFARDEGELDGIMAKKAELESGFGARVEIVKTEPFAASSTEIRAALPKRGGTPLLTGEVYAYIVRNRLYGVRADFGWLRERAYEMLNPKRIPHVKGCEEEAVRLAGRWGADAELAAEAGILHDITKKLDLPEQLKLCERYGIIIDELERGNEKLLHSKTGAAVAENEFGSCREVVEAICWHTTGKPDMSLLEKIIYMADYIEPNRDFDGVEEMRRLAYEDLDAAMAMGLEMSLGDVVSRGKLPHENSVAALKWYKEVTKK